MVINHNMSAIYSHRMIKFKGWELDKNIEKLSSGIIVFHFCFFKRLTENYIIRADHQQVSCQPNPGRQVV